MLPDRHTMRAHSFTLHRQRGFTLIELIMVIVIMGVIGGVVAVFMRAPIDAYFDSARRAALTDVADTAVRRIARDVRKALPNSIRVTAPNCLEFIPTRTGGRYRKEDRTPGDGSALDFTAADTLFNMLGDNNALPADQRIQVDDVVVVSNLGIGITGADAYVGQNTAVVSAVAPAAAPAVGETAITIASRQFLLESGSNRFHVVPKEELVVTYACLNNNLYRLVNTINFASNCPAAGPVVAPILASNVQNCTFTYNGSDLQRNGLVQIDLRISSNDETVSLYHEVHVNNSP